MTRRVFDPSKVLGLLVWGGMVFLASSEARAATTITLKANCSLAQAISAVNNKVAVGGCAAGTGGDTIVVPVASSVSQTTGALVITRSVTIQSSVARTKATIETPSGAPFLPLFEISPLAGTAAKVTFTDILLIGHGVGTGILTRGKNSTDSLTVNRCEFSSFNDSGIFTSETSLTVSDSFFHDNTAQLGAGIRVEGSGNNNLLSVSTSTFLSNSASDVGGGIYYFALRRSTITNSTFAHNQADIAGGLFLRGTADVNGSTIAYNTTTFRGAGGSGSQVNFTGTLLAGNTVNDDPTQPSDWDLTTAIASFTDSLLGSQFGVEGAGTLSGDIVINSLGSNSVINVADPLQVVSNEPFDLGGDMVGKGPPVLPLVPTGPAVDAIPASFAALATDQRGFQRGVDVPGGVGGNRFDIGAFEYDTDIQAESLFVTGVTNGTLTQVTGQAGFLPTLGSNVGKGIKFVPNAVGASVQLRLPMAVGANKTKLLFHILSCPTCGTYRIDIQDDDPNPHTLNQIGNESFSSSTIKTVTTPALSLVPGLLLPGFSLEENDNLEIRFTLVSKPANSNGQMTLDFIRFQ